MCLRNTYFKKQWLYNNDKTHEFLPFLIGHFYDKVTWILGALNTPNLYTKHFIWCVTLQTWCFVRLEQVKRSHCFSRWLNCSHCQTVHYTLYVVTIRISIASFLRVISLLLIFFWRSTLNQRNCEQRKKKIVYIFFVVKNSGF